MGERRDARKAQRDLRRNARDLARAERDYLRQYGGFRNLGARNRELNSKIKGSYDKFSKMPRTGYSEIENRANFQLEPYDYYCGTNARVFFGDIWVDDIVTIQYNIKQDKEPIYGYASQTFDAVARGVILAQGSFTIAFKEMGYLNLIQGVLEAQIAKAKSGALEARVEQIRSDAAEGLSKIDPALLGAGSDPTRTAGTGFTFSPTGSAQIIRQGETIEDILKARRGIISEGMSNTRFGFEPKEGADFEDFAEMLEDTIWGDRNGAPYSSSAVKFRRADEFDYKWIGNRDIGGINVAEGNDYSQVLNIMITFGDINDLRGEHTMVVLNDVHIVNTSMIISPTGEPIGETYFFFARDINQSLSSDTLDSLNPIKYNIGSSDELGSKDKSVAALEKFLSGDSSLKRLVLLLHPESKYVNGKWQKNDTIKDITLDYFPLNNTESTLDQVIKYVERAINTVDEFSVTDMGFGQLTAYPQWVFKATLSDIANRDAKPVEFRMVIDQQIPNTLTYRVIIPTRHNYTAFSPFTREDLFTPPPPPPPPPDEASEEAKDAKDQLAPAGKASAAGQTKEAQLSTEERYRQEAAQAGMYVSEEEIASQKGYPGEIDLPGDAATEADKTIRGETGEEEYQEQTPIDQSTGAVQEQSSNLDKTRNPATADPSQEGLPSNVRRVGDQYFNIETPEGRVGYSAAQTEQEIELSQQGAEFPQTAGPGVTAAAATAQTEGHGQTSQYSETSTARKPFVQVALDQPGQPGTGEIRIYTYGDTPPRIIPAQTIPTVPGQDQLVEGQRVTGYLVEDPKRGEGYRRIGLGTLATEEGWSTDIAIHKYRGRLEGCPTPAGACYNEQFKQALQEIYLPPGGVTTVDVEIIRETPEEYASRTTQ